MTDPSRYDKDPGALAWARGKIEAVIDRYVAFAERASAEGHHKAAAMWQAFAITIGQDLLGQGDRIGSFDERLPGLEQPQDHAAAVAAPEGPGEAGAPVPGVHAQAREDVRQMWQAAFGKDPS